ncbi:hypothetical protein HPB49_018868 [Dermacentor silvarum]|uniref:Uncharacterized protein n=1 Tax=Dermacentor silvarum TaxID=543639 RepID=A0ACB8DFE2_DERSI|nr:hypothetical protein HPB49_018868 [Dermacentor silvarum]
MSVMGKGRVQIPLSEECGGSFITLDVLYMPDLNGNLLSEGRIEERGLHVTFAGCKAEVDKGHWRDDPYCNSRRKTTLSNKK